ncbi:hypothetical protein J6590_013260, partial [Homalodisca vitripennis]
TPVFVNDDVNRSQGQNVSAACPALSGIDLTTSLEPAAVPAHRNHGSYFGGDLRKLPIRTQWYNPARDLTSEPEDRNVIAEQPKSEARN